HSGAPRPAFARCASYGGLASAEARERVGGSGEPGIQTRTPSSYLDSGFAPFGAPRNDQRTMILRLSNAFGRMFNALAVLAALTLLAMVVLVTADILLRNMTRTGFPWANEVSEYALYVITLLTA